MNDVSSVLVMGSSLIMIGLPYGPIPAFVSAATLTVYVTPSVRFANKIDFSDGSVVMFVRILEIFSYTLTPRTITLNDFNSPLSERLAGARHLTRTFDVFKSFASSSNGASFGTNF